MLGGNFEIRAGTVSASPCGAGVCEVCVDVVVDVVDVTGLFEEVVEVEPLLDVLRSDEVAGFFAIKTIRIGIAIAEITPRTIMRIVAQYIF
jgi:hypothetical protein